MTGSYLIMPARASIFHVQPSTELSTFGDRNLTQASAQDIWNLSFAPALFDDILCLEVMEH